MAKFSILIMIYRSKLMATCPFFIIVLGENHDFSDFHHINHDQPPGLGRACTMGRFFSTCATERWMSSLARPRRRKFSAMPRVKM
jgi:hypothetical protein